MTPHELTQHLVWMGSRTATERASTLRLFTENFNDRVLARSIDQCVDCYIGSYAQICPVEWDLREDLLP